MGSLKKLGLGIEKMCKMGEGRNVESVIDELESEFLVNNKKKSLKKFVDNCKKL